MRLYPSPSQDLGLEELVEDDLEKQQKVEAHAREFLTQRFAHKLEAKGVRARPRAYHNLHSNGTHPPQCTSVACGMRHALLLLSHM